MPNLKLRQRELEPDLYIPYLRHVSETVISLRSGALMIVLQLEGISFETEDTHELNTLHDGLNTLWRNAGDERLALWTHLIRRRESVYPGGEFKSDFARRLDDKYKARMVGTDLFRNDLFLTLIWSPRNNTAGKAAATLGKLLKARKAGVELHEDSLRKLQDVVQDVTAALARYKPRTLQLVERQGLMFSEPMEFLHRLISGEAIAMPLPQGTIASSLYTNRVIIGREAIEIRGADKSRFAGMFGVKEYPATTRPGMLNGLLKAPFELTLTQSFGFIAKADAKVIMTRKQNQMISSGDKAVSQLEELDEALDDLESNKMVMGEHHLVLIVHAPTHRDLLEFMSFARSNLASGGAVVAREDLALEAAYWSQLPGNFRFRARSGALTSRNFAALSSFHGYPQGKAERNHWGSAVALLKTTAGSPYYFNFHHGDLGNTLIIGPSGSGKTVTVNFLLSQLQKHNPQIVFFDKDRGADLFIRAAGGAYLPLKNGKPTGCAPLKALDLTRPGDLVFASRFIRKLVATDRPLSAQEGLAIDKAVRALADMPREQRSLMTLGAHLDRTEAEGVFARLERWMRDGQLGWVFDGETDEIKLDLKLIGYDMTDFLDNEEIRTPLMMYLFHRVEQLIDGRRICIVIDEFWKALGDEAFRDLAQNKLKTIRKQNGFMLFATQSPADALKSPISHTIIEQCPTKLFFPNANGAHDDYVKGFSLTEREFELVKKDMTSESRRFLIKQEKNSIVAELNLNGFDDEIAILSARAETVDLAEQVIAVHGDEPAIWLHHFNKQRRSS